MFEESKDEVSIEYDRLLKSKQAVVSPKSGSNFKPKGSVDKYRRKSRTMKYTDANDKKMMKASL